MHTALKQRIEMMRGKIQQSSPVMTVPASSQVFVTPENICHRLVSLAGITDQDTILEPSAGTGAILRAIRAVAPAAACDAVELNAQLCDYLRREFDDVNVICCDFLHYAPQKRYSHIIMNPPFNRAADIHHIQHACTLLKPGGVLTAICLNGPRQNEILKPLAEHWEPLPGGLFAYTGVSTAILRLTVA
ncbi:methyltransferase [Serratia sp. 14-2641]|uniref:methyltransferase n=1 Tax=Serratia sp. 14-2641 TaxID=1841657 RepID=UPI00080F7D18|nr:methyltransferase [Serratia sp. 14-2641]OCJ37362.1 ribosomal RNA adenine dimethylase [Serratia sp. 14-2641]